MYTSHEDYLHKQAMASMASGAPSHDPLVRHRAETMFGEAAGFIHHPQNAGNASSNGGVGASSGGGGLIVAVAAVGALLLML
jgi:hypothetical protein